MTNPEPNPALDALRDRNHAKARDHLKFLIKAARGMAAEYGAEKAWSALAINLAEEYKLGPAGMAATGPLAAALLRLGELEQEGQP